MTMNGSATYTIQLDGKGINIRIDRDGKISIENRPAMHVDYREIDPGRFSLLLDGRSYSLTLEERGNNIYAATIHGKEYQLNVEDERRKRLRAFIGDAVGADGPIEITAPMPGMVLDLLVKEGDEIKENQPLVILEAMKMENEIRSVCSGTVKKLHITSGQPVEKGQQLITITP